MAAHLKRSRTKNLIVSVATSAAVCAAGASIATGAQSSGGGTTAPSPPRANDVVCVNGCLDLRTVARGGKVQINGRNLDFVSKVSFPRTGGGRIIIAPLGAGARRVNAKVPNRARSGRVRVIDDFGSGSTVARKLTVKPASAVEGAGPFELTEANVSPHRIFYFGKRKAQLRYLFRADRPVDVRIDIVSRGDGAVIRSFVRRDVQPFTTQTLRWNGTGENGRPVGTGAYKMLVGPTSEQGTDGGGKTGVRVLSHIFPLRAPHSYGDGLGAGRGHQGQDIFARCGKPVVAAQGGKVMTRAYHYRAGYYLVIEGRGTRKDYVYMHLERRARPKPGRIVKTGQRIGYNSDTGNASGCHVHFELWSAPGWYRGGSVLNPTPKLRRWDKRS